MQWPYFYISKENLIVYKRPGSIFVALIVRKNATVIHFKFMKLKY